MTRHVGQASTGCQRMTARLSLQTRACELVSTDTVEPADGQCSVPALRGWPLQAQGRERIAMWEKLRVVFTIPELRKKILLHARPAAGLSRRLVDSAADRRSAGDGELFSQEQHRAGPAASAGGHVQRRAVEPGHDLRPGHHALYLGLDYLPAAGQRLAAARSGCKKKARAGRKKINEYTRYATVLLCLGQSWFYLGWLVKQTNAGAAGISRRYRPSGRSAGNWSPC